MPDHPNQPQEYDAVLGGQTPIPPGSAILGGIEGVKRRLASAIEEQRIAALSEALNYGEAGLDLVIRALQDGSGQVEKTAYLLLRERTEPRVKQALKDYNPWKFVTCLRTLGGGNLNSVFAVAISPNWKTVVGASSDATIKVWNLCNGKLRRTNYGHLGEVNSVVISPDGKTIASGSCDYTIKVWNLHTGRLIKTLDGHFGAVFAIVTSPNGQNIITGSKNNTIKIWNLQTGKLIRTLDGHFGAVYSVAISPDGQILVSGSMDNTIKIWNFQTGKLIRTLDGHLQVVHSVAISPDGQTMVSGSMDNTIKIWNLQTGKLIRTIVEHSQTVVAAVTNSLTVVAPSNPVNAVAISPDGQTIVSGSSDNTIKVWNLHSGELIRTLEGHLRRVYSLTISPDGQTLVSGSADNIKIWGIR
jgi:WD40 repeat protein